MKTKKMIVPPKCDPRKFVADFYNLFGLKCDFTFQGSKGYLNSFRIGCECYKEAELSMELYSSGFTLWLDKEKEIIIVEIKKN